jgi:rhamnogalacturonyl hydrolase YesR
MYGFAPFAVLYGLVYGDPHLNIDSAMRQLEIIYQHTLHKDTGLIVHGYDGSKQTPWADSTTGASPIVWGRSLAWYTIGLVDALAMAEADLELRQMEAYKRMRKIYESLAAAVVEAIRDSARKTGRYGVWQVFDQPGKHGNFVEASATAMLVYSLGKGLRYGYIKRGNHKGWKYLPLILQRPFGRDVEEIVRLTYGDLVDNFVRESTNGTLDFEGTSVLSSLHVSNPDFDVRSKQNWDQYKNLIFLVLHQSRGNE